MLYKVCMSKRRKFPLFFGLYRFVYKYHRSFGIIHTSFEEMNTEDSASSLGEVSSLDDDFDAMYPESGDSNEEGTDDDMNPHRLHVGHSFALSSYGYFYKP